MKSLSLLKFSRYFFGLFLVMNVLPLVGVLLWNGYHLQQTHQEHQKRFLDMIARDIQSQIHTYLTMNTQSLEKLSHNLPHGKLSVSEAKTVLQSQTVWPFASAEAKRFLQKNACGQSLMQQFDRQVSAHKDTVSDFCLVDKVLYLNAIVPLPQQDQTFVIIKPVPLTALISPGPHNAQFYAGTVTHPESTKFAEVEAMPPNLRMKSPNCHKRPLSPPPFFEQSRLIPLKTHDGSTIATIRLRLRQPPRHEEENREWLGAVILLTGFFTSLFAGRYIQKNFIMPVTRLALVTDRVQAGDLSPRVDVSDIRQSDVLQAIQRFNAMLDQLNEKERLRNNFISNLTHDFRTPLIAQSRSLELLIQEFDELELPQQRKLAQSLVQNNHHLLGMVNQLLETYQFENGHLRLDVEAIALPDLIHQCFERLSPLAESRNIELSHQFSSDFPKLMADPQCMSRVFTNLIANAIENIPKGSRIEITGHQTQPGWLEIHVKDNGQGISTEEQAQLFERYYAGTGDTRKLGSGLGLYICKMLVEAHHGSIEIESVLNAYTNFKIRLPLSPSLCHEEIV